MSTERDIIIERLEQKLASRDKELEKMQDQLRESILADMELRLADKQKLRESTLDEIRMKFGEKISELIEMNKSLRDSVLEQHDSEKDAFNEIENRMNRMELRLVELNSAYDGVMKELLDQKSIIQELAPRKKGSEEPKPEPEIQVKEVAKQPEAPKPRGEYIIADNYVQKARKKEQQIIEAEERMIVADDKPLEKGQRKKLEVKRSERLKEGVEIFETPKRGR